MAGLGDGNVGDGMGGGAGYQAPYDPLEYFRDMPTDSGQSARNWANERQRAMQERAAEMARQFRNSPIQKAGVKLPSEMTPEELDAHLRRTNPEYRKIQETREAIDKTAANIDHYNSQRRRVLGLDVNRSKQIRQHRVNQAMNMLRQQRGLAMAQERAKGQQISDAQALVNRDALIHAIGQRSPNAFASLAALGGSGNSYANQAAQAAAAESIANQQGVGGMIGQVRGENQRYAGAELALRDENVAWQNALNQLAQHYTNQAARERAGVGDIEIALQDADLKRAAYAKDMDWAGLLAGGIGGGVTAGLGALGSLGDSPMDPRAAGAAARALPGYGTGMGASIGAPAGQGGLYGGLYSGLDAELKKYGY